MCCDEQDINQQEGEDELRKENISCNINCTGNTETTYITRNHI